MQLESLAAASRVRKDRYDNYCSLSCKLTYRNHDISGEAYIFLGALWLPLPWLHGTVLEIRCEASTPRRNSSVQSRRGIHTQFSQGIKSGGTGYDPSHRARRNKGRPINALAIIAIDSRLKNLVNIPEFITHWQAPETRCLMGLPDLSIWKPHTNMNDRLKWTSFP